MSAWITFRLVKFLALTLFAVGVGLGVGQKSQADRVKAAFWLATPALWFTWFAGYLLMKTTHRTLSEPFIGIALIASLTSLHGAILSASKASPRAVSRWLGPAGLGIATAAMVARDAPGTVALVGCVLAAGLALAVGAVLPPVDGEADPQYREQVKHWFTTVARFEGLSLITMMLIAMPLRKLTGMSLDQGTGALGWGHGILVLFYLQALQVAAKGLGWSWGRVGAAFVSSLLPFGTFIFEWVVLREAAPTREEADVLATTLRP